MDDDTEDTCDDIGFATVNIADILKNKQDIIDQDIPSKVFSKISVVKIDILYAIIIFINPYNWHTCVHTIDTRVALQQDLWHTIVRWL